MQYKLWIPIPDDFKIINERLYIQGEFTKENGKIRVLYGYDQYILSSKKASQPYKCLKLEFDMKFEILRKSIPKKDKDDDIVYFDIQIKQYNLLNFVHSLGPIIGLQFLRDCVDNMVKLRLNAAAQQILEWRAYLRGRINQWQFHNMFKVYKKIGKGNFASVYQGERIEDKQQMAIKAFAKQASYQEVNGKNAIINELTIMRKLNNTHLMKLYEVYETNNSLYITLELLEGGSLYDLIQNKVQINTKQIQQIIVGILLGLLEMHKKEIMHRDLKLENILFKKSKKMESVVIADFGLATYVNEPVYLFCRCGTPGFVAPEVINTKDMKSKYSSICDIYSLGLVFYLLLTGKSAFNGKSYSAVVKQNREANNASESVLDLLKQMLEKDPKKRINAERCLNHPFLFDMTRQMMEDEDQDYSFDEIDERIQIQPMMDQIQFQFDVNKNQNSPLQSPIQSPGFVQQQQIKQQKQIDSQNNIGVNSLVIKGKVDFVDSAQTIGTPTKNSSVFSPSPQLKPSRFSKQSQNKPLLKYAKKD